MIGLILLYFIGKAFYELAEIHRKSKWTFAILGIASYYIGTFIGGMLIALVYELLLDGSIDDINEFVLSLMALPIGILMCWGLYIFLRSRWEKKETFTAPDDVLDANLIDQDKP